MLQSLKNSSRASCNPIWDNNKNSTSADSNTTNKVLKEGKDGIKEVTYKIKYQNEVEIEKQLYQK